MWYIISHFQVWRQKFFSTLVRYIIDMWQLCSAGGAGKCTKQEDTRNVLSHHASTREGCLCCTCKSFSKRFASWHCMTCIIRVRGILYPQELQVENTPSKRLNSFLGLLRYSSFITLQWVVSSMWRIKAIMGWWMLSENVTVNRSKTDINSLTY